MINDKYGARDFNFRAENNKRSIFIFILQTFSDKIKEI